MKLLYFATEYPYPSFNHAATRTQAMLRAWTEMGWDVTFVCFPRMTPSIAACPIMGLRSKINPIVAKRGILERTAGYFKTYHHNLIGNRAIDEVERVAREHGPFDAVLSEELPSARVALELKARYPGAAKKFAYVAHNYEADLYGQIAKRIFDRPRRAWLAGFERRVLDEMDATFAFSEVMREQFAKFQPRSRLFTTSACFDLSRVRFDDRRGSKQTAVFVGALQYHPNVDGLIWFGSEILPLLSHKPEVVVAGSHPGPFVRSFCMQNKFELVDTPPDMGEVLNRARLEVVPLRKGSGVRGKIIEAMAAGVPVVSTTLGAEGIPVTHGLNILLADRPADFAERILEVLVSPELTERLSREGRRLAEGFDGDRVARQLASDLKTLLA